MYTAPPGHRQACTITAEQGKLEMWASAQRDGRPADYRWRPLFNAVWLTPTIECRPVTLPRRETR